ncbi:MAG: nuclear transport factor 2 family protein [Actinomycetota bacterium]
MTPPDGRTERLWAEAEIQKVLLRYARGVDRLDLELVRACYHPDATDTHGSFTGTVDEFLVWVERVLGRYDSTMHLLGNPLIDHLDDRHAAVETYGLAFHRTAGGSPEHNLVTGFRFVDRFERRGDRWRIAHRIAVSEWSRVDREADWWSIPDTMVRGRRDRCDPVYGSLAPDAPEP